MVISRVCNRVVYFLFFFLIYLVASPFADRYSVNFYTSTVAQLVVQNSQRNYLLGTCCVEEIGGSSTQYTPTRVPSTEQSSDVLFFAASLNRTYVAFSRVLYFSFIFSSFHRTDNVTDVIPILVVQCHVAYYVTNAKIQMFISFAIYFPTYR